MAHNPHTIIDEGAKIIFTNNEKELVIWKYLLEEK